MYSSLAYARMEVLAQAIGAAQSLDEKRLADYLHTATFQTIAGTIKFGPSDEQAESRVLVVQCQGIEGNSSTSSRCPVGR